MSDLTLESKLVQCEGLLSSTIDDDLVLMSMEQDKYFGLNVVSHAIWNAVATPQQLSAVCGILLETFDIDSTTCQEEVLKFATELVEAELVKVVAA